MDSTLPADDTAPEPSPETPEIAPAPETETAPEPTAEAASESADGDGSPKEALADLAARAEKGRLSPADETLAALRIKDCLLDGRAGVATVVELLPKFAWMVAVNGVIAAWPELTSGFRTQLIAGIAKDESDSARRLRLSLSRGLFKIDEATALKLAVNTAKDFRDKETGALSQKDAQMFASVFIGRAKPWVATLPLAELKPAEAETLAHCSVLTAFTLPHPPVAQLGVIKWIAAAGLLDKLQDAPLEALKNGVSRWSPKWQGALRKEVAELPEGILAVLKGPAARPSENAATGEPAEDAESSGIEDERNDEDLDDADDDAPAPAKQYPVYVSKTMPTRESQPREESAQPSPSPAPASRGQRGGQSAANLHVGDVLRQIDAHVSYLRAELKSAQNKLKDGDRRPRRAERSASVVAGEPTMEELARLNHQLEARIGELQQRIDDLTGDSEDRAASFGVTSDQPVTDGDVGLRALLALKLQEDYEDFLALEKESNDIVVQAHYRTLLGHIFEVLTHEGVALKPHSESGS